MTATGTRKRSRVDDEDGMESESVPLTKRINNLHLENDSPNSHSLEGFYNDEIAKHIISNGHTHDHNGGNTAGSYNPELGLLENPYYYNNNKILYEMHLQRLRRQGVHQDAGQAHMM